MSVMTRDNRFEDVYSPDMERRPTNMCEVLDRVENRGIQKRIEKGEDTILSLRLENAISGSYSAVNVQRSEH